jgi:hypothetical protein
MGGWFGSGMGFGGGVGRRFGSSAVGLGVGSGSEVLARALIGSG